MGGIGGPVPIPQDPGIAPGGGNAQGALPGPIGDIVKNMPPQIAQQFLQGLLTHAQGQKAGGQIPGAVQSPGGAPAVGGVSPGMGQPGQSPALAGTSLGQPPRLTPSYQPQGQSAPIQTEFSTSQGRDAAGIAAIASELKGAVGKYEAKKAQEKANKAEVGTMLWYQAVANKDYETANKVLEQYGDAISKAFGKGVLPTYGSQGQKQGAEGSEPKQPKPEKPTAEQGGLVSALGKIKQKLTQKQPQQPGPNLPVPKPSTQEQIQGKLEGETNKQLGDPKILGNVVGSQLGQQQLPVEQMKAQAEYQKVVTNAMADLMKADKEIQGRMDVATKEIAGKKDVANIEGGYGIQKANIEAWSRIQSAMLHAHAALKVGQIGNGVQALTDAVGKGLDLAKQSLANNDKRGADQAFQQASSTLQMLNDLAKGLGTVQGNKALDAMGKDYGIE